MEAHQWPLEGLPAEDEVEVKGEGNEELPSSRVAQQQSVQKGITHDDQRYSQIETKEAMHELREDIYT